MRNTDWMPWGLVPSCTPCDAALKYFGPRLSIPLSTQARSARLLFVTGQLRMAETRLSLPKGPVCEFPMIAIEWGANSINKVL